MHIWTIHTEIAGISCPPESGPDSVILNWISDVKKLDWYGGTQILFRNLPKISNFGKTLGPSCSGSKIVPTHKFWVHDHILESSNRIQRLEIIDWDKYPLKWFFSKTVGTIVISVQRSSGFPNFIQIRSIFLVFFVSWSSAFLKIGNHGIDFNSKYIFRNQDIYKIV